jgi:WD40 repeat protein
MAVGYFSKDVRLWNITEAKPYYTASGVHDEPISCCKFLPDGLTLATMSKDDTIKIMDLRNYKTLHTIEHEDLTISS